MEINASGNIIDGGYAGELSATSFSGDGSSLTNLVGLPTSLAFSNYDKDYRWNESTVSWDEVEEV